MAHKSFMLKLIEKLHNYLDKKIFNNYINRLILESYMEFSISSMVNLFYIQINTKVGILNSFVAIIIFILVALYPIYLLYFFIKYKGRLDEDFIKERNDTLFDDLRQDS